jgi:hypothetical protein
MACSVEPVRTTPFLHAITDITDVTTTYVSLINTLLASLANNVLEVGYVFHPQWFLFPLRSILLIFIA